MSTSRNLPPVRHLPHWSRVGCLDKLSSPRLPPAMTQQHPQPAGGPAPPDRKGKGGGVGEGGEVAPRSSTDRGVTRGEGGEGGGEVSPRSSTDRGVTRGGGGGGGRVEVSARSSTDTRVESLQKNIQFLQQQHRDTLQKLHAEIDGLRRDNKELQYKLIMELPKTGRKALSHSHRGVRPPVQGSETERSLYLEQPLQDTRPPQERGHSETLGSVRPEAPEPRGGLITSLNPLRIHSNPSHPPRAPTLQECEIIIRQLYNANSMQSQEIVRVKAVLRDIVFNKKITPENYILTKAYLADGNRKVAETERFPQLALQQLPKKPSRPSHLTDGVILPALKPCLTSNIAERHKRTQAAQRSRLKRAVQ